MSEYDNDSWLEELPVWSQLPPEEQIEGLKELGMTVLQAKDGGIGGGDDDRESLYLWGAKKPWQHTDHVFGFIPTTGHEGEDFVPMQNAGNLAPDESLKGKKIKISLERLKVADYPGFFPGRHTILFHFSASDEISNDKSKIHFNQVYEVESGQAAGILNVPIFVGLTVGKGGVAFECSTINVKNDKDEALLKVLDSEVANKGLELIGAAQPALVPLASMAKGIVKTLIENHKRKVVQKIQMGLDFDAGNGARLREGSYVVVQTDKRWDWREWVFDRPQQRITHKSDEPMDMEDFNYLVFRVSQVSD